MPWPRAPSHYHCNRCSAPRRPTAFLDANGTATARSHRGGGGLTAPRTRTASTSRGGSGSACSFLMRALVSQARPDRGTLEEMFSRRGVVTGTGGSVPRIYGPRDLEDGLLVGDAEEESRPVLAAIERCYARLKNHGEELGRGGFCFGLLDPAANIRVNSSMPPAAARWPPPPADPADMARRSLHGLRAFLTRLFPYLPDVEALRAAGADPLLASLLVLTRRGVVQRPFIRAGSAAAAVEAALRCAAIAAGHPDPQKLVLGWKLVSPVNDESWELAESRLRRAKPQPRPPPLPLARAARKRAVLATIHGFYLQALARLPEAELQSRYHRSMLAAGHCYGPLDPVSNIIVNTVWYDRAFPPPSKEVTLRVISTRSLMRIAARSFYGLLSFLCTRYPDQTPGQVLERLLVAKADLRAADPSLLDEMAQGRRRRDTISSGLSCCYGNGNGNYLRRVVASVRASGYGRSACSVQVAYAAAATAACHPAPLEQQELLGSPDSLLVLQVASMRVLGNDRLLSSENVKFLVSLLVPPFADEWHKQPQPAPEKVDNATYAVFSRRCLQFWDRHKLALRKVEVALTKFNIDKVHKYRLRFICGVNELVSGPEYNTTLGYNPGNPLKYHHTHINFLATCQDPESAHAPATLFFAECGNYSPNEFWCFPVNPLDQDTEHARCIYSEEQGTMIVHPAAKGFHGRDIEFEKVLRGERLFHGSDNSSYTNNSLYAGNAPDQLDSLEDDYIYSDYVLDPDARKVGPEMLQFLFMK